MDFRRRKLFSRKDGFDIADRFARPYGRKPGHRAGRVWRAIAARRVRRQEKPILALEVARELHCDPFEDEEVIVASGFTFDCVEDPADEVLAREFRQNYLDYIGREPVYGDAE